MEAVVTVLIVETMRVRKNIIQLRRNWIIQSISSWGTLPLQTLFHDQVWVVRGLQLSKFLYILFTDKNLNLPCWVLEQTQESKKSSKSFRKILELLVSFHFWFRFHYHQSREPTKNFHSGFLTNSDSLTLFLLLFLQQGLFYFFEFIKGHTRLLLWLFLNR